VVSPALITELFREAIDFVDSLMEKLFFFFGCKKIKLKQQKIVLLAFLRFYVIIDQANLGYL
jgi:hypothetical protein